MNLQENIRRILREDTVNFTMILRRVPIDDLEREFEESLDMSSNMLRNKYNNSGEILSLERFIDVTISILIDGIHYELYSTLPEDIQWYDEVNKILKKYYKEKIENRYKKLISKI
jgi:hypothetical protein